MKMNNLNYYAYFLFLVVLTSGLSRWLKNIGPKGLILKIETCNWIKVLIIRYLTVVLPATIRRNLELWENSVAEFGYMLSGIRFSAIWNKEVGLELGNSIDLHWRMNGEAERIRQKKRRRKTPFFN